MAPFQPSVREAYLYTLKNLESSPVINDAGPLIVGEVLDLLEYMVLTVYRGSLA